MRFDFDPEADAFYLRLSEGAVAESEEVKPGIVFDFDPSGQVVGIEILHVSRRASPGSPDKIAA